MTANIFCIIDTRWHCDRNLTTWHTWQNVLARLVIWILEIFFKRIVSQREQQAPFGNTGLLAGIRNEQRYSLQRVSNAHANREYESGHACVYVGHTFPSDCWNWTTRLELSPIPLSQGRRAIWKRIGGRDEGGSERTRPGSPRRALAHPSKASFRRRGRRHEGAAPRLPCYRRRDGV